LRYASGYQVGGRLVENLWRHWGISQEYGFSNQPATFTGLVDTTPTLGLGQSIHRLTLAGLCYPSGQSHRLRPYAFAGPGLAFFRVHEDSRNFAAQKNITINSSWEFTMTWGMGAKYMILDRLGVGLRFADALSRLPAYGLPSTKSQYSAGFRPEGFLHNWQIGMSFVYGWDR
jgi:opacity protein-like surface antigen